MRRAHKFGAIATEMDGKRFASRAEAARYRDLKRMERAGMIEGLETQPVFKLVYDGKALMTPATARRAGQVMRYTADFQYRDKATGRVVVEDVKGMDNEAGQIRRAFLKAFLGVDVVLITKNSHQIERGHNAAV